MLKKIILIGFISFLFFDGYAQFRPGRPNTTPTYDRNGEVIKNTNEQEEEVDKEENIDSLRAKLDNKVPTIQYTSKYIKFTKEQYLVDSNRLFTLDTNATDFQYQNVLNLPKHPTMNLGLLGTSSRTMLFEPRQSIGFDVGYHYLDAYLKNPEDVIYYQARAPFTDLYYSTPAFSRITEQTFYAIHSQNIKPNWNIGANLYKTGSRPFYGSPFRSSQKLVADNLKAAVWTWYESNNKRYTLLANGTFNHFKVNDYGSIFNDSIFTVPTLVAPEFENVRLNSAKHDWKNNSIYLRQFYNIGKITLEGLNSEVLPSQRVSHSFLYNKQNFSFTNQLPDTTGLLKNYYIFRDSSKTDDQTNVTHIQNDFSYSFYVRGKAISVLKNELKVNAGLVHDFYNYEQYNTQLTFQNVTVKGNLGYHLSDRANLVLDLKQIFQGRNAGDFYYQAKTELKFSDKLGKIEIAAYSQNQSPSFIYQQLYTNHHRWSNKFEREKTQNISFNYLNEVAKFGAKAEYFLISNHLYFGADNTGDVKPFQFSPNISMLKLSLEKDFTFGKFTLKNYVVYQKTDFESILRSPELYTFHSFYYHNVYFDVLKADIGIDVRYFSKYTAPSYAPAIGQFYNAESTQFDTYPIADVWIRTTWKRTNLFLKYEYANQNLQSKGYYTVNRYPMPYAQAKFGVSWKFYD